MEFKRLIRTTIRTVELNDYFEGKCPLCYSNDLFIRSSRIRILPDLGSPVEKVIIHLTVATIGCKSCEVEFSPEHPDYPPKYEYSQTIIEYALTRYHYHNTSGNVIARDLATLHQVQIPEETIYSWLKRLSPEFLKTKLAERPENIPSNIKSITVDGCYVNLGKAIIGKKKHVESFSVTRLEDGRYLLMWWE